jgi:hypothetical protein
MIWDARGAQPGCAPLALEWLVGGIYKYYAPNGARKTDFDTLLIKPLAMFMLLHHA